MMNRSTRPLLSALALAALTTLGAFSAAPVIAASSAEASARGAPQADPDASLDADTRFQRLANDYIEALWRLDPDAAIAAGRYEFADQLPAPDRAMRARSLAFATQWLADRGGCADAQ